MPGRRRGISLLLLAITLPLSTSLAADRIGDCRNSPLRVADCFTIHGRLTSCTGIPNLRIWVVGSKRILGVVDATGNPAGDVLLPPSLAGQFDEGPPCGKAAFGDFTLCPLAPDRPGIMRRVCMAEAAKILVQDW